MRKIFKIVAFGTLLFPLIAGSTSFIEQPLPDIVAETPVIVRGKIGASHADWGVGSDGNKRLYTYYELQISEAFKGQIPSGGVTIREMGGEKDGIGMQVAGAARFDKDEDVVVTLSERNPDGTYDIRGLATGKYNIKQDQSGREVLVGAGVDGHIDSMAISQQGSDKPWTLDAFRDLIRSQGGAGSIASSSAEVQGKSPTHRPSTLPSGAASQQAPQLQTPSSVEPEGASGESSLSFARVLALALALGIAIWVWIARRRRR